MAPKGSPRLSSGRVGGPRAAIKKELLRTAQQPAKCQGEQRAFADGGHGPKWSVVARIGRFSFGAGEFCAKRPYRSAARRPSKIGVVVVVGEKARDAVRAHKTAALIKRHGGGAVPGADLQRCKTGAGRFPQRRASRGRIRAAAPPGPRPGS